MGLISLTLPIAGQNITAGLHSTNYTTLQTVINGNLDANTWASGKIFAPSKLTQESAVDGDPLVYDTTDAIWKRGTDQAVRIAALAGYPSDATKFLSGAGTWISAGGTVYRKTTVKAVTNTVAETDLLNAEFQVAANAMSTDKLVRLTAWGDWIQNGASTLGTPRFKLKLGAGATVVIDTGAPVGDIRTSATRYGWKICCEVMNLAARFVQLVNFEMRMHYTYGVGAAITPTAFTTGEGVITTTAGTPTLAIAEGYNAAAIDTTAAMNVALAVINPTATATCETKLFGATMEVI